MMKGLAQLKITVLLLLSLAIGLTSCEKDDFISEPTATSVIITGVVTTTSGKPIANLPVSLDYFEGYWLAPPTTIHKAKGITDSNGRYCLFFEPEADKSDLEQRPTQDYYLCADLGGLSSAEYMMPSDFKEIQGTVYKYGIHKILAQGENININLFFPRKREMRTELKNFVADKILKVRNKLRFGADKESFERTVELNPDGNGNALIPFAIDEANDISIHTADGNNEICSPREITITGQTDSPVVFDNAAVLDNCRFNLSLYSNFAFNGKDYPDNAEFKTPAPFDFIGFRIVHPDGRYEFPSSRYQYYDSIVWSSPDFQGSFRIYDKKSTGSGTSEHLVSQWGSYFFFTGIHQTMLSGYKNGRAIYSDTVTFELKDRDFLCFDWNRFDYLTEQGTTQNIYCQLDEMNEYHVCARRNADDEIYVDIYLHINGDWPHDILLNWQQTRLEYLMWKHLGHWVEYDKPTVGGLFRQLPADDIPGKLYENETTRAIVMHSPETEYDKDCYYIHAEPK